jgi:hypothetical protein
MSGGYFYKYFASLENIAEEIEEIRSKNENNFSLKTLSKMRKTVTLLRKSSEMVKRVDYLLSGDEGEESFNSNWEKTNL